MSKKPKYDSSRNRNDYTLHPGRRFDLQWEAEPGPCYLFALDERQAAMLRKMVQVLPKYHWVWGLPSPRKDWDAATWQLWDDIETFVDELEACLVSGCEVDQLNRSIRELTAVIGGQAVDLTQPIPDQVDFSAVGVGLLPTLNEHLSSLGPIPKAGDTIMTSLQKLVGHMDTLPDDIALGLGGGMTIQDLIDALENTDFSSAGLLGNIRDILEILIFLKLLFGPTMPTTIAFQYWDSIKMGRWQHNSLTLQAYQAVALRGIQHGITPFEDGDGVKTDEEILEELETIPWLAKSAARYFSGSVIAQAEKWSWILGPVSKRIYEIIRDTWNYWYEQYINIVGTPQPARTLTGVLTQISQKLVWDQAETSEGDPYTITDFTNMDVGDRLRQIADKLAQDGVTLEDVLSGLDLSVTNNVTCQCGGSGCGGCGIGDEPPADPGTEGDPPPPGFEDVTDDEGNPAPPGTSYYQTRKCKVANALHAQTKELITKLDAIGIVQIADELGISAIGTLVGMVGYIIGELTTPIPILDGAVGTVIGYLVGLVLSLLVGDVDLDQLKTALETYEEDLVCAFYKATNAIMSVNDYLQVLADNGVSYANRGVILAILGYKVVNHVFFQSDEEIEAALDSYVGPVDCVACAGCDVLYYGDFSGWTSADESDAGCSTSATIGATLETTLNVGSLPFVSAIRRYTAPLSAVTSGGWVPSSGKVISVVIDATSDGLPASLGIRVDYQTDPAQSIGGAFGNGGTLQLTLNSDDTVVGVSFTVSRSTSEHAQGSISTAEVTQVCFS